MTVAIETWLGAGLPTDAAAVLLAEVVGSTATVESEARVISEIGSNNRARNVIIAIEEADRELLWKGRKSAFGAIAQLAPDYYLHDTVVPRTRLVETMAGVYEIADRYGLTMCNVFHAGDGNLHPLIAFDASDADVAERVRLASEEIVELSLSVGGALSGEHGIGVEKRDLMAESFSGLDLDAQARVKDVFDPAHLLNPNKILPSGSRCFDFGGARKELPEGAWV
jgi:glycolate oxidase